MFTASKIQASKSKWRGPPLLALQEAQGRERSRTAVRVFSLAVGSTVGPAGAQRSCAIFERTGESVGPNRIAALCASPAIAFTVAVIVNIVAVVEGKYTSRVGFLAVLPLALQLFTGLYLFVLPYATKWRSGRSTA